MKIHQKKGQAGGWKNNCSGFALLETTVGIGKTKSIFRMKKAQYSL